MVTEVNIYSTRERSHQTKPQNSRRDRDTVTKGTPPSAKWPAEVREGSASEKARPWTPCPEAQERALPFKVHLDHSERTQVLELNTHHSARRLLEAVWDWRSWLVPCLCSVCIPSCAQEWDLGTHTNLRPGLGSPLTAPYSGSCRESKSPTAHCCCPLIQPPSARLESSLAHK